MNILHLISSPRGEASFSIKLGNKIVEKLKQQSPESTLTEYDLTRSQFPHLEEVHLTSFYTAPEQRSPELVSAVKHSDESIALIKNADVIVIGVPMYNFNIHSSLKAFIDHIARAGITFSYSEKGAIGLVKNKKIYLAISTGGVYSEGPMKANDFIEPYMRFMLGFLGMNDITVFRIEGLNVPALKDLAVEKAFLQVEAYDAFNAGLVTA